MSFNGSGTYSLPAGNPVTTGTTISSTWANTTLSDLATALTNTICKDGQSTPTANIKMGGFKITNVAAGTAATDNANVANVQNATGQQLGTVAGTNTITATANPTLTAYTSGQLFSFIAAGANTGATTLNVDTLGAKNVLYNNAACSGGEIASGAMVSVRYDGTSFHLVSSYASATLPVLDTTAIVKNAGDTTKQIKFSAASITTATTRTYTMPDINGSVAIESSVNGLTRNGKMSITAASATGTYTADQVVVQTALNGTSQRLNSYSQACNLATTGAGGMDTGAAPVNGFVSLYAIAKSDGTTSILACAVATSTASIYAGGNMPAGYTYSALLGIIPTNGSSQFKPGLLIDRKWCYQANISIFTGQTGSGTLASQSISSAVPAAARFTSGFLMKTTVAGDFQGSVCSDGTGTGFQGLAAATAGTARGIGGLQTTSPSGGFFFKDLPIITSQTIWWSDAVGNSTSAMNISEYTV